MLLCERSWSKGLGALCYQLQKLKFYHRLKRSCNDTVRKIFLFMQLNNECAQLFATYSSKSDSVCKFHGWNIIYQDMCSQKICGVVRH